MAVVFMIAMPHKLSDALRSIAGQMQNLPTSETGARQLMQLVQEAGNLITTLEEQSEGVVTNRCRAGRTGLDTEVKGYLQAYWSAIDPREKITRLTQARAQAHYLLGQVIAAAPT